MNGMMQFPETFEEFIKEYSFKDHEEVYTNGAMLIPCFRVEQGISHYCNTWISVKERLPKDEEDVFVIDKWGNIWCAWRESDLGKFDGKNIGIWVSTDDHLPNSDDITHWMPRPYLPQEGK